MSDLYEVLNVDKDASAEEIKKSYRKKAQESHPDSASGNAEVFKQVHLAYDTLGNPESRKNYDETGSTERSASLLDEAEKYLLSIFDHVITLVDEHNDYIALARQGLDAGVEDEQRQVRISRKQIDKLERKSGRIKVKDGDNLYQMLLDSKIQELHEKVEHKLKRIAILEESKKLLENYTDTAA